MRGTVTKYRPCSVPKHLLQAIFLLCYFETVKDGNKRAVLLRSAFTYTVTANELLTKLGVTKIVRVIIYSLDMKSVVALIKQMGLFFQDPKLTAITDNVLCP